MIPFVKTQALGNDFILVKESDAADKSYDTLARRICDRYFGIGADGLILWTARDGMYDVRIFNRDGSEAECSGNGLRCTAAYFAESGQWSTADIKLRTVSGVYTLRRVGEQYEADMGVPLLAPAQIPFTASRPMDRVINEPITAGGEQLLITACSTGNPHCSIFVDQINETWIDRIGPALENHPAFPNRTNVEFIHVLNEREIEVRFWERGVGRSNASGTGSCGATVASVLTGRTGRKVTVHALAGDLVVEWPEGGRLKLTSTASVVADGHYREAS